MNTHLYIAIFACHTENCSPEAPPDLFIVRVYFLKVNESLFYKETVESFYPVFSDIYFLQCKL